MEVFAGREIREAPKDARKPPAQPDEFNETEALRVIVNKKIDVAVLTCLVARSRTEQIQGSCAEILDVGSFLPQGCDDVSSAHSRTIPQIIGATASWNAVAVRPTRRPRVPAI